MNGLRRLPLIAELVPPTLLLAVVSGVAFVAIIAAESGLQTPVEASLLTLLYYLLPVGVGIAILPSSDTMSRVGLRKAEHALLGYFVGLMIVALVVVVRERNSSPEIRTEWFDPALLDYLILGLGALGWLRILNEWRDFRRAEDFTRVALWCSPLFIVPYTVSFLVFSRYPLTDLFQFTHIMKGAEEFAGFDRLNPFTADSYAPVIQPLLGILLRLTGANSLDAVWLMPLPAYLLRVAVLYAVGTRMLSEQRGVTVFVAISLPFFGTGVLTNGDLAALGCLLVMALVLATLQQRNPSGGMTWIISVGVTAALVATLASWRLLADWLMLGLAFLTALAIPLTARRPGALATFITACLGIAVVAPLHRSTVLLVPAIAFSLAWITKPPLSRLAMAWASAALTIVGTVVVVSVLLNEYGNFAIADPGKAITLLIDGVFGVRFSTSHDAMLGSGAKVALFEMARSVGPLIALWSLMLAPRCLSNKHDIRPAGHFQIRSDATWLTACALIVLLLLGLPFAYRAVFIPMVLFAVLIAQHYTRLDDRALIHVSAGLVALSLVIAVAEYAVPENSSAANYYINRAMPAVLLCLLPIVAIGIASISRPTWLKFSTVMVLVWAVLFEKQVIRYHFFHYSFPGEPPPRTEPLSHYTLQDIKLAELIRHQYGDGILISDPYTLAITRALTGLNSIVTFSNLDTMNAQAAEELRQYLQSILLPGQESSEENNCGEWQRAARLLGFGISSESNYALFQAANPGAAGRDVLRAFGYRSGLLLSSRAGSSDGPIAENRHAWLMSSDLPSTTTSGAVSVQRSEREAKVITVINGRTIEWAFGLFANQRHDGSETWESGSSIREMLVAKCNGMLGPGHSVILAHPLGRK